jgi:hypothetical protein
MRLLWQTRSNPLAWWWACLTFASSANIALWLLLYWQLHGPTVASASNAPGTQVMVYLSAAYVFGCAFRSILPRADVQRICLFDTWLSSVFVGRTVATVAEVCFAAQWAIILNELARMTGLDAVLVISYGIVPLIIVAQCCSWYGVLTTNYLAHAIENSIWAVVFFSIAISLCVMLPEADGEVRMGLAIAIAGIATYLAFLITIDLPMYFSRWRLGRYVGHNQLSALEGLREVRTHWVVTHDPVEWKGEIAWMSLYFTTAVWASLALCFAYGLILVR